MSEAHSLNIQPDLEGIYHSPGRAKYTLSHAAR